MKSEKNKRPVGNKGRINNTDNYRDRDSMSGEQEILGEDIGNLGKSKGADRKRLANEIEDNAYDPEVVVEVSSDPRFWGEEFQIKFADEVRKSYQESLKKYVRVVKKAYYWLRDDKQGKKVNSVVGLRSILGFRRSVWMNAVENSEEFAYYSDLIYELIGSRIHELGLSESKGQIFKIHSLKNHLPEEFSDKKEVSTHGVIEVLQISQGDDNSVKKAIEGSKKRLKK